MYNMLYLILMMILVILISTYNRRKFRSQTSDNMDRWKAEQGRGREKRKIRRKKSRRERVRRKKMQMREKVGKSRNTVFFPMIWGSGGSKSRLAKPAGAEPAGQMTDTPAVRRTITPYQFQRWAKPISKSTSTIFGQFLEVEVSVEKVHAVMALAGLLRFSGDLLWKRTISCRIFYLFYVVHLGK